MAKKKQPNGNGGLIQIETVRRRREPLASDQTESAASRDRTGWQPQSGPSGVIDSWWETPDQ